MLFSLASVFMKFQTIEPDVVLKDGDEIDGLKVIHTPGHTKGSICLYKPGEILFAGDALRTDKGGNPKPSPKMMNLDTREALESVEKLAALEFHVLLPGHGVPAINRAGPVQVRRHPR